MQNGPTGNLRRKREIQNKAGSVISEKIKNITVRKRKTASHNLFN
jgi:hypothetical protein